ncbi:hypothetical protein C2S51_037811 [Perilla frutescens var. frutescens]|nr:hypothetical protein C2S51_037811 [Perilla frutescens var. frutescens]
MKYVEDPEALYMVDIVDTLVDKFVEHNFRDDHLEQVLFGGVTETAANSDEEAIIREIIQQLYTTSELPTRYLAGRMPIPTDTEPILPSHVKAPVLELKVLPEHLKYAYLGEQDTLPVIISNDLSPDQESRLLRF